MGQTALEIYHISEYIETVETCSGMRIIFSQEAIDSLKDIYSVTTLEVAEEMKNALCSNDPKELLSDLPCIECTVQAITDSVYCDKYIGDQFQSADIIDHSIIFENDEISINTLVKLNRRDLLDIRSRPQ